MLFHLNRESRIYVCIADDDCCWLVSNKHKLNSINQIVAAIIKLFVQKKKTLYCLPHHSYIERVTRIMINKIEFDMNELHCCWLDWCQFTFGESRMHTSRFSSSRVTGNVGGGCYSQATYRLMVRPNASVSCKITLKVTVLLGFFFLQAIRIRADEEYI